MPAEEEAEDGGRERPAGRWEAREVARELLSSSRIVSLSTAPPVQIMKHSQLEDLA